MILRDYECDDCGEVVEWLDQPSAPRERPCRCGGVMTRRISAPKIKTQWGYCTPGTSQERPPWAMDTRAMAEGQSRKQWRESRRSERRDEVRKSMGVDPKVFV